MDTAQQLAARLQHDARTPLNSILGMVELLESTALEEDQRQYVNVLRRATEELLGVIEGLPAAGATASTEPVRVSGTRILLVDDTEDNRFLVVRYLQGSGVTVDEAHDGAQAVAMVQGQEYDVVLMDVEMPVMDGLAATRAIREWERTNGRAAVRIIALTAHNHADALGPCRGAGCDELLTKPLRRATLLQALSAGNGASEVADLVPAYLKKRRADIVTLRDALARRDFGTIRSIAHKLSGTGAGYGLPAVSTIGAALERAAKASEAITVDGLIAALEAAVQA